MQLNKLDPAGAPWNEAVLHALGASTVTWPPGGGPIVTPDIDLSTYAASVVLQTKQGLHDYAASVRYAKETGGTTVSGRAYLTDRETQAKLTAGVLLGQVNPSASIKWKLADGSFITLDAAGMTAVAAAVGTFVQTCFATEASVAAGIDAGAITSRAQIDSAFAG